MSQSLASLESRRSELLRSIGGLNDMRPGSIVGAVESRIVIALARMIPVTAPTCA